MRTPLKHSYGRRKRRHSHLQSEWDEIVHINSPSRSSEQLINNTDLVSSSDIALKRQSSVESATGSTLAAPSSTSSKKLKTDIYEYRSSPRTKPGNRVEKERFPTTTSQACAFRRNSNEITSISSVTHDQAETVPAKLKQSKIMQRISTDEIAIFDQAVRKEPASFGDYSKHGDCSVKVPFQISQPLFEGLPSYAAEMQSSPRDTMLSPNEVDLEPAYCPTTPPKPPRSRAIIPPLTPDNCVEVDLLSSIAKPPEVRSIDAHPRRLLVARGSADTGGVSVPSKTLGGIPIQRSLESFLERVESNLIDQTQLMKHKHTSIDQFIVDDDTINADVDAGDTDDDEDDAISGQVTSSEPISVKVTYSKQRSFLSEAELCKAMRPDSNNVAVTTGATPGEIELQVPISIKDVHDLRQGGGYKRFVDEVSYLLEGLASKETLQGTLLELARKLTNTDFAGKFRTAGFEEQVVAASSRVDDSVSLFALMIIISASLQVADTRKLHHSQLEIVGLALGHDEDISRMLESKTEKIKKVNRSTTLELRQYLSGTAAFVLLDEEYRLSPRLLALTSLTHCEKIPSSFLKVRVLPLVGQYNSATVLNFVEIRLISSLLEANSHDLVKEVTANDLNQLCSLASSCLYLHRQQSSENCTSSLNCLLRMLITLATGQDGQIDLILNSKLTKLILEHIVITAYQSTETAEDIILCLGLLVCLVEESDQAASVFAIILSTTHRESRQMQN